MTDGTHFWFPEIWIVSDEQVLRVEQDGWRRTGAVSLGVLSFDRDGPESMGENGVGGERAR